jgi:hypothetical protein
MQTHDGDGHEGPSTSFAIVLVSLIVLLLVGILIYTSTVQTPAVQTPAVQRPAVQTPASGMSDTEARQMVGLAINLNGFLCGEVLMVTPLKVSPDIVEVECIEYRGGSERVRYLLNAKTKVAWKP